MSQAIEKEFSNYAKSIRNSLHKIPKSERCKFYNAYRRAYDEKKMTCDDAHTYAARKVGMTIGNQSRNLVDTQNKKFETSDSLDDHPLDTNIPDIKTPIQWKRLFRNSKIFFFAIGFFTMLGTSIFYGAEAGKFSFESWVISFILEVAGAFLLSQLPKAIWLRSALWILGAACLFVALDTMRTTIKADSNANALEIQNLEKDLQPLIFDINTLQKSITSFEKERDALPMNHRKLRNSKSAEIKDEQVKLAEPSKKKSAIEKKIADLKKIEDTSASGNIHLIRRILIMILTIAAGHAFCFSFKK